MKQKDFWFTLKGSLTIGAIVLTIWVAWPVFLGFLFPWEDIDPGTSGDMFGSLTALFSGLAFAGLVSTLLMQSRELQLQRQELSQTREVFSIQRFESTLFGLLKLLNDHIASVEVQTTERRRGEYIRVPHSGRHALEVMAEGLPSQAKPIFDVDPNTGAQRQIGSEEMSTEEIVQKYEEQYRRDLEISLGPYFRLLYNIFRLVESTTFSDDAAIDEQTKKDYSRIVRAHLSSSEVKLLLYNGASQFGARFQPWIVKFALLKHLPAEDRAHCSALCRSYNEGAFG